MSKLFKIIIVFFLFSCSEEPPVSVSEEVLSRAEIQLSLDTENYELNVSTNENFAEAFYVAFSIIYNKNTFSIDSYVNGDGVLAWSNLDENALEPTTADFILSSVSANMNLVTVAFSSPTGNYENSGFHIENIHVKDNSLKNLYYSCSNSEYEDPVQCRNSGGHWKRGGNFHPRNICYKDWDPITDEEDGTYNWIYYYCD